MALSANVTIKNLSTIKWGTGDVAGAPFATAIVETISGTDSSATPIFIQDNEGLDKVAIILNNGYDFNLTVLYDSAISWPAKGAQLTLTVPGLGAKTCYVSSIEPTLARGKEQTIQVRCFQRTNI